jgi:hypothetical protein
VEGSSADGPVVGVLGHAAQLRPAERRRAGAGPAPQDTAPAAPDIVSLIRFVRAELERLRSVVDPQALYARDVRPEIWAAAERRSEEAGALLVAHLDDDESTRLVLRIRRTSAGDVVAALEDSHINVFLARDEPALAHQVGRYLAAGGFLRPGEEVEVQAAEQAPALSHPSFVNTEEVESAWS